MNLVIIKGRTTADVDLRQTTNGTAVVRFTLAVDRQYKNANGEKQTDFINCIAWQQTAETLSKYVTKGQEILVNGEMQQNNYEKDNVKHYSYIVNVHRFEFCGNKSDNNNQSANGTSNSQPPVQNNQNNGNSGVAAQNNDDLSIGDLSDFEEILSDGEVPF